MVRVETSIELYSSYHPALPETAWFEIPEKYESFVDLGMEGFLTALVPVAMALGEDIEIDGPVSERLLFHLKRYQQMVVYWRKPDFKKVQISCKGYVQEAVRPSGRRTAMMFSGGVDALYTLLKNLPENQLLPGYQITHGIFLNNFDFLPDQQGDYQEVLANLEELFSELGLELITADHNFHLIHQAAFDQTYPAVFAGLGHTLSNGLQRLFIASSAKFDIPGPETSDLRTDQCLSSEDFEIVYDAIVEDRIDKVRVVNQWALARKHLYVCKPVVTVDKIAADVANAFVPWRHWTRCTRSICTHASPD